MKFALLSLFAVALFGLASAGPLPEPDANAIPQDSDAPPLDQVTIDSVTWAGSGCPPGSAKGVLSDNKQILQIIMSQYKAQIGGGVQPGEAYKNCDIIVKMRVPQGWSFTLYDFHYEGFYSLDKGVKATQRVEYYFQPPGSPPSLRKQTTWVGYKEPEPWTGRHIFGREELVWCRCERSTLLNINTSLFLSKPPNNKGTGFITTDKVTQTVEHKWGIQWKRCK